MYVSNLSANIKCSWTARWTIHRLDNSWELLTKRWVKFLLTQYRIISCRGSKNICADSEEPHSNSHLATTISSVNYFRCVSITYFWIINLVKNDIVIAAYDFIAKGLDFAFIMHNSSFEFDIKYLTTSITHKNKTRRHSDCAINNMRDVPAVTKTT